MLCAGAGVEEACRMRQRVIIYVDHPDDYLLASRVAAKVTAPGYVWPDDNHAIISFQHLGQEPWEADTFGARKNKTGVTIWGPQRKERNMGYD